MPPDGTDDGARAAKELRAGCPTWPSCCSPSTSRPGTRSSWSSSGRFGYLLKDRVFDVDDFMDALRRVAAGGSALDPEVVATLLGPRRRTTRWRLLTPREREVLALMAEGRNNVGIARRLCLTDRTVETHIASIMAKLGLHESGEEHRRVLAVLTWLGVRRPDDGQLVWSPPARVPARALLLAAPARASSPARSACAAPRRGPAPGLRNSSSFSGSTRSGAAGAVVLREGRRRVRRAGPTAACLGPAEHERRRRCRAPANSSTSTTQATFGGCGRAAPADWTRSARVKIRREATTAMRELDLITAEVLRTPHSLVSGQSGWCHTREGGGSGRRGVRRDTARRVPAAAGRRRAAYDGPIQIGHGQTNSQPRTVAACCGCSRCGPATGSSTSGPAPAGRTALLAHLTGPTGEVIGVELEPELVAFGRANLARIDRPWARIEPADPDRARPARRRAVRPDPRVRRGARRCPQTLVDQLTTTGRMVIPVAARCSWSAHARRAPRSASTAGYRFVPLR